MFKRYYITPNIDLLTPNSPENVPGYNSTINLYHGVNSETFQKASRYSCVLGATPGGKIITLDLKKAPHVLIAGVTGAGKSVLLNTIICSLLYKQTPASCEIIMIDPKRVELTPYNNLKHLRTPVIKGVENVPGVLSWLIAEMEKRYKYLERKHLKNIDGTKIKPIFIFIDELADLMLQDKKHIEPSLIRIAQLGRAAGIHLIIATQRPSKEVVTGLLKANIPTKICLTVSSVTNSLVILDHKGGERLTGNGDAIIKYSDSIIERRFRACYTPDNDIQRIVDYYKKPLI